MAEDTLGIKQQKPSNANIVLIIVVIAAFILGGVLLFFLFQKPTPITITESQISNGEQIQLDENQKVIFKIDNSENSLEISSIEGNFVKLSLRSLIGEDIFILDRGGNKEVDLDGDGESDLMITFLGFLDGKVNIKLYKIEDVSKIQVALKMPLQSVQFTREGERVVLDNTEYLLRGNRFGIVREPFNEAYEVDSVDASLLIDEIFEAKDNNESEFTSTILEINLPKEPNQESSLSTFRGEYIVIFYLDSNNNKKFDKGEGFVGSWLGGKNSFQLQFLKEVSDDQAELGAREGWDIVEGGFPQTFTQNFDEIIFYINPLNLPIID